MVRKLPVGVVMGGGGRSPPSPLLSFLKHHNADIYCFQETKLTEDQLDFSLQFIDGYESFWSFSKLKRGYSGVVTYAKTGITLSAKTGFGEPKFDDEGRIMMTDHHNFVLCNIYFPNAGMGPERLKYKMEFYDYFLEKILMLRQQGRHVVVVGDVNTAYEDIDIWNPQYYNVDTLFPQERIWMKKWYESGFVDTLRYLHPLEPGYYSWFDPMYPYYRKSNKGWRLDYTICDTEFHKTDVVDSDIKLKPQPPVPPHPPPTLSSIQAQKKQPNISSFFKPKSSPKTGLGTKDIKEVIDKSINVETVIEDVDKEECEKSIGDKGTLFAFGVKRKQEKTKDKASNIEGIKRCKTSSTSSNRK